MAWGWLDIIFSRRFEKLSNFDKLHIFGVHVSAAITSTVESVGEITLDGSSNVANGNSSTISTNNSNSLGSTKSKLSKENIPNSSEPTPSPGNTFKPVTFLAIRALYAAISAHVPALVPALISRRLFPVVDSIVVLFSSAFIMLILSLLATFLAKRANLVSAAHQLSSTEKGSKQQSSLENILCKLLRDDSPLAHYSKSPTITLLFKLLFVVLGIQSLFILTSHRVSVMFT